MESPRPPATATAPPRAGRSRRRAAWSIATLLAGCAAAELGVRALGLGPPPQPSVRGQVIADSADPRLRFENVPGASQWITYQDARGGAAREVEARVNAHGLRGED